MTRGTWIRTLACVFAMFALSCALCACAPQQASEVAEADVQANDEAVDTVDMEFSDMPSFYDNDTGLYPDTAWNAIYLNAGNRGCNSCHEDLNDLMTIGRDTHPIERSGNLSTHNATILDCLSCHTAHTADFGMYFADAIHSAHNSSEYFVEELGGNCWSCHVVTDSAELTELGTWDIQLWEEVMYDGALGGYPDYASNLNIRIFMKLIGHESSVTTDVSVDENAAYEVDMRQDLSTIEDSFTALNHNATYGEEQLYDFSHTVTIEGVNNPRTFTYEELAAMPQTTVTATNQCLVAGSAGHNIYNATYTGVSLAYLVEQCGGLAEGVNQAYLTGWDEWECSYVDQRLENYVDHGIIALKMFDEDISYEFGGPLCVVAPGVGGGFWCKWVKTIEFNQGDAPFDYVETYGDAIPGDVLNSVSGAWFENDGVTFSLADGVELEGYAFAYAQSVAPLSAIEFSTDLGVSWQRFEVPESMDPYQWVTFTFSWDPPEAGTYIVKVRGVNENGAVNKTDGSVIVTVTE